jgi:hypothetical protein
LPEKRNIDTRLRARFYPDLIHLLSDRMRSATGRFGDGRRGRQQPRAALENNQMAAPHRGDEASVDGAALNRRSA